MLLFGHLAVGGSATGDHAQFRASSPRSPPPSAGATAVGWRGGGAGGSTRAAGRRGDQHRRLVDGGYDLLLQQADAFDADVIVDRRRPLHCN